MYPWLYRDCFYLEIERDRGNPCTQEHVLPIGNAVIRLLASKTVEMGILVIERAKIK
jgi:hypothetical protein